MDNIQVRKFVSQNRAVAIVCLLADPTIELYCPSLPSRVSYHRRWYQCTMHHRCGLGIGAPMFDCVDPTLRYYRPNSMKSILLSQAIWLKRNKLVHSMLARLWCAASVYSNPKSTDSMLHHQRSKCVHPEGASLIECNCHAADNPIGWLGFYCSAAKYQRKC